MIKNMPKYAAAPIKCYLETGRFKDHEKFSIGSEQDAKESALRLIGQSETFMATDNGEHDLDRRVGVIETTHNTLGPVHAEFEISEDGKNFEIFYDLGSDESKGLIYKRNHPEALDVILVTPEGGPDEAVMHHSFYNPKSSFVTEMPGSHSL